MLKICFAGLGSIGQRHLKNIVKILSERKMEFRIDAVRSSHRELSSDIAVHINREYQNFSQIPDDYDIFFVTNPTINHMETIQSVITHTKHMFIEKPVFHKAIDDVEKIFRLKADGIYYVACPLRYTSSLQYLKKNLNREEVYSIRAISSSYLPDWRKGSDYRKIYSADAQKGGGVTLDLIHELDYLTDFFGMPEESFHIKGKYSNLEIDSDDLSVYLLKYKNKLAEVHLDYFGRVPTRQLELYCRDFVIKCDIIHNTILYLYPNHEEKILFETKDMYIEELNAFLDMIQEKEK